MKFTKKFLIIFIFIYFFISQINYGLCSDNGLAVKQPVKSTAVKQIQQQKPKAAVSQPVKSVPALQANTQSGNAVKANHGFIPALIKMLKILACVIIFIIVLAGIILFYKRIKSKASFGSRFEEQSEQEVESNEPTNISEAVSSFVRHKIKRTS